MKTGAYLSTLAARVGVAALGVAAGILVARALGPQGKGALAAAQLLIGILVTLASGVGVGLAHFLTKRAIRPADMIVPLAIVLAVLCGIAELAGAVDLIVGGPSAIVAAAMLVAPAGIVLAWQSPYYAALGMLTRMNLQLVALATLTLIGIGVALTLHAGVAGVLAAWVSATTLVALIVIVDAVRVAGGYRFGFVRLRVRELSTFGLQAAGNSFLGWLTYRVDAMLIGMLLGLSAFGVYSVAVNLSEVLLLVSRSVTTVLTRDIGARDSETSARITSCAIRTVTFLVAAIATVAWFVVPAVVQLLYGNRFSEAIVAFRILLPGIVAFATVGTFCAFFLFQVGRPLLVTWLNAWTIGVEAALCALLIPRLGIAGAALACTLTYVIGAAYCTVRFCSLTSVPARDVWLVKLADLHMLAAALRRGRKPSPSAEKKPLILITGAAGKVGTLLRPLLRESYRLRLTDKIPVCDLDPAETFVRVDLADRRAVFAAAQGADAIVHLGCISDASYAQHARDTMLTTYNVLEAARSAGIKRVIYASSGHVTGFYLKNQRVSENARLRPDSMYGFAKAVGEVLASLYADKFGLEVFAIRIGHCSEQASGVLDRAIWISPRDLAQLVGIGLEHPDVKNDVVYGTSRNTNGWWDLSTATALGYRPADSADDAPADGKANMRTTSIFQGDYRAEAGLRTVSARATGVSANAPR
ncbi:MAG: NAD-dependent epimerase/dehydratase family protein [Candidatus Eremiobacteraeota bacterium]|nr:NAD-dependent epimerase/dehydratase family protein [Candidatus Eremiobacteraeota bacterium]